MSAQHRRRPGLHGPRQAFLTRVLNPVDRLAQAIYSILIVLSFTLAAQILYTDRVLSQASSEAGWLRQLLVIYTGLLLLVVGLGVVGIAIPLGR